MRSKSLRKAPSIWTCHHSHSVRLPRISVTPLKLQPIRHRTQDFVRELYKKAVVMVPLKVCIVEWIMRTKGCRWWALRRGLGSSDFCRSSSWKEVRPKEDWCYDFELSHHRPDCMSVVDHIPWWVNCTETVLDRQRGLQRSQRNGWERYVCNVAERCSNIGCAGVKKILKDFRNLELVSHRFRWLSTRSKTFTLSCDASKIATRLHRPHLAPSNLPSGGEPCFRICCVTRKGVSSLRPF